MTSSAIGGASSPLHSSEARRSQFTYRQFAQLTNYSTSTPLRVIAHIDLDAFYAQCEMVRLGVPETQPLAVQQWQGLIAVNYPAREWKIGRHCNVTEAKKLCPELIAQHVATWREGDDKWEYRDDAAAKIATDKVSLDPYRLQSRKILAVVKETLPQDLQKVEKASIDEVFLDLSAQVHSILVQRFSELSNPPPYDDPTELLPLPSVSALDWQTDALVDLDEEQETQDPDWDDIAVHVGSEIVREVRARIREALGYTCSAGIAKNKLLSKLGSAHKKPDQQTVVRGRAVEAFMSTFKLIKLRNLGGKLGDQVVSTFSMDTVRQLLDVSQDQMKAKLGHETGTWVYNTIRGIEISEVSSRTQIKSMLSAKSFRPVIGTVDQAIKWLRIFSADIFARLVEEGVLEHKRRPKTINLHHRQAGQMRSRQGPIPQGKLLDEEMLFGLAKDLLNQIVAEGRAWPCANLSLSVGGFEDGIKGNSGMDAFVVRGDEAELLRSLTPDPSHSRPSSILTTSERPGRKRPADTSLGIHGFLTRQPNEGDFKARNNADEDSLSRSEKASEVGEADREFQVTTPKETSIAAALDSGLHPHQCQRCGKAFREPEQLQSHADWHMAKDLHDEENITGPTLQRPHHSPSCDPAVHRDTHAFERASSSTSKRRRGGKLEQGQRTLNFR